VAARANCPAGAVRAFASPHQRKADVRLPRNLTWLRCNEAPSPENAGAKYIDAKMNVDTDMQYAFTRAVAGHMFKNYDGVLKVDGEREQKSL
jgi:hypothetical protein